MVSKWQSGSIQKRDSYAIWIERAGSTRIHFISLLIFLTLGYHGKSQERQVTRSTQQYIHYFNRLNISDQWSVQSDANYRFKDDDTNSQYQLRTMFSYQIDDKIGMGVGFAHVGYFDHGHMDKIEYRPHQDFSIKDQDGKIGIRHRFRLEERILRGIGSTEPASDGFNFRLRYQLMFNVPLLTLPGKQDDRVMYLNFGDELFMNAGHEIVHDIFDMNRVVLGSTIELNSALSLWLTYQYQFKSTEIPNDYLLDHVFRIGVIQNIDISIKKAN